MLYNVYTVTVDSDLQRSLLKLIPGFISEMLDFS